MKRHLLFIVSLTIASLQALATDVMLENCETLSFDKARGEDCQVLKGNVRFRQDATLMYCDSAYFYSNKNSFDAFGHVRVVSDSTTMSSNKMYYDGNEKIMRVRENIVMQSGRLRLETNKLDYFRVKGYAFYEEGAKISDPRFELTSQKGYYYPNQSMAVFNEKVVVFGQDYRVETDTLKYNSKTSFADVLGPSVIYRGKYIVHTTKAWMDNENNDFKFYERTTIEDKDKTQKLIADTIFMNQASGVAQLFGNVDAIDNVRHVAAKGGYGYLEQRPMAKGYFTRNAVVKEFSDKDTLYLHADTLRLVTDEATKERQIQGHHNVRFFRNDFQGKGEHMFFLEKDSMMYMVGNPVLWADANQLTGDTVRLYMKNRKPDWLHIVGKALVAQRDDSLNYNQLGGKELFGYFENNLFRKAVMKGNAVSVYFPKDKKGDLVGVVHNTGNQMTVFIDEKRKLERILLEPGTDGTMYPPFEAPEEALFLKGFTWQQSVRPKKPSDVLLEF
ncbi:MAG: hypothetical protein KBT32_07840 [Bacteroidales bacterium]|nr:hypothetical protein [Candidatus Physcocola equi]